VTRSTDSVEGSTTYTYLVEDYYSHDAEGEVDISVTVKFDGNTASWRLQAFVPGTSDPAELTFRMLGIYGGFSNSVFGDSNGYDYSTTNDLDGDPILVYSTDGEFVHTAENFEFNFPSGSTEGLVEITILGYERCATSEAISLALNDFTLNYLTQKNTEILEVEGTCTRACTPSTSAIETSSGNFDLADVDLCFDKGYGSEDPSTLLDQVDDSDDLGSEATEGFSFDYQDVAVGTDKTLNALLTVTSIVGLEYDEAYEIDEYDDDITGNKWINTYVDYLEGEADRYISYTLFFYEDGDVTKTPVNVSNLEMTIYDIDSYQFFESNNVSTYTLAPDTILSTSRPASGTIRAEEASGESSSSSDDKSRLNLKLIETSQFVLRMGVTSGDTSSDDAWFGIDFSGGPAWENPPDSFNPNSGPRATNQRPATPTKPQVTVTPGPGSLNVEIAYAGSVSRLPSQYTVTALPGGNSCIAYGSYSNCDITGLKAGVSYKITITATNSIGTSGKYVSTERYKVVSDSLVSLKAKRSIDNFAPDSPKLLKPLKAEIRRFISNNPKISNFTCTGYTAGPVKPSDKALARKRATNVCAFIEKIKPEATTTISGKTPGLTLAPSSRKVVIRGYSAAA
jgi:hypothetical protein